MCGGRLLPAQQETGDACGPRRAVTERGDGGGPRAGERVTPEFDRLHGGIRANQAMRIDERLKAIHRGEVRGGVARWERDLRADLRRLPEERTTLSTERVQRASADEALQRAERQLGAPCQVIQ